MEHEYKNPYKPLDLNAHPEDNFALICCPKCDSDIPAKNINLSEKMAKCDGCNAIFSIKKDIVSLQSDEANETIPKPVGIDIIEYNDQLELTLGQPQSVLYAIVMGLSPIFSFILFLMYFDKGVDWSIFPAIGSLFTFIYSTIKLIFTKRDKTYVTLDRKIMTVEYRPKNFLTDKVYETHKIEQVFVKRDHNGLNISMLVNEPDGQRVQKLLGGLRDITKAKYIEQEIEKYLGIKNKKVAGEEV